MRVVCNFCGNKNFVKELVQYIYHRKGKFLVVNNVPCEECTYCGERYYEGPVLERIEREFVEIYHGGKKPKTEVSVPVEEYAEVAD